MKFEDSCRIYAGMSLLCLKVNYITWKCNEFIIRMMKITFSTILLGNLSFDVRYDAVLEEKDSVLNQNL